MTELDPDNFFVKCYCLIYGIQEDDDLPTNLCTFVWSFAWGIILSIVFFPALLIRPLFNKLTIFDHPERGIGTFIIDGIAGYFLLVIMAIVQRELHTEWSFSYTHSILLGIVAPFVVILGTLLLMVLVAIIIWFFNEYLPEKFKSNDTVFYEKRPNVVAQYFYAIKDKYCPQIKWKRHDR